MTSYEERMDAALLKQIRVELFERDMPHQDLAAATGMYPASLSRYLTGKTGMPLSAFYRIAEALEMDAGELMVRAEARMRQSMMS